MEQKDDVAPEVAPVVEVETPAVEPAKPETAGEVLNPVEKPQETVSLGKFMKEKKARQELEAQLADLQKRASEDQMTGKEISTDLKALAEEHGVDVGFLDKFAKTIEARAKESLESTLQPIREKERQDKIDTAFKGAFEKAIASMPEYATIANPEVIKTLSLDPKNANKTFSQIIEDTYGSAISGKRTVETPTHRGGNTAREFNYDLAVRDKEYFKEVMADPVMKAKYNEEMLKRY